MKPLWKLLRGLQVVVLIASFGVTGGMKAQKQPTLDAFEMAGLSAMLRTAYEDVKKNYYDPKFHGVDWDARYAEYKQKLATVTNYDVGQALVAEFLATLNDSHTYFAPPRKIDDRETGFRMQMIGNACYVTEVKPGTDAAKKLHVGDRVLSYNGAPVSRENFSDLQYVFNLLAPRSKAVLDIQRENGPATKADVTIMIHDGLAVHPGGMSISLEIAKYDRDDENSYQRMRDRVVVVDDVVIWRIKEFDSDLSAMDDATTKANKAKGLVIDLRGNPGGYVDTLRDVAGHLFEHQVKVAINKSRKVERTDTSRISGPVYTGKLVVLIDSESASSAEILARLIQIEHRGTVMGDRSAGAVMEAMSYTEHQGASDLIYWGFSITVADVRMSDNQSLENVGVKPDVITLPTQQELAEGKDPVLAAAVASLGGNLTPEAAGKLLPYMWPKF